MPISMLPLLALLVQPPADPMQIEAPPPELPDVVESDAPESDATAESDPGFFGSDTSTSTAPSEGPSAPPPMPEIEELPPRDPESTPKKPKRPVIEFDPNRGPAGTDGG